MKKISIIIPVRNEEQYITKCLESILNSDYQKDKMEIIIVDGLSNDNTVKIVEEYQKEYDYIRIIINSRKIVPTALNLGIKNSIGDYIIRLDAHSIYPKDYFSKLIFWAEKLNADNVGAVAITDVLNHNKESISIKKVMSDKFGVGNSLFRIGVEKPVEVDTVPFGCYKKEVFEKYGFFDERLERNQDIEFNKRIRKCGAKIYLIPEVQLIYFCRETYIEIFNNRFNTGKWIIKTSYFTKTFSNLSIRHFVPLLFVLSLIVPSLLAAFQYSFLYLSLGTLAFYLCLIFYRSYKIRNKDTRIVNLVLAFLIIHFSYGTGSLKGIFEVLKLKFKGM